MSIKHINGNQYGYCYIIKKDDGTFEDIEAVGTIEEMIKLRNRIEQR